MPTVAMNALYALFAETILAMPESFSSHDFIQELTRNHQDLYVEALFAYRLKERDGRAVPFMVVHSLLARELGTRTDLVECVGRMRSRDLWDQDADCAKWRKV